MLVQPVLTMLNVIMDAKNNKVAIPSTEKPSPQCHMLRTQSDAVSSAACRIYNYDDDISCD